MPSNISVIKTYESHIHTNVFGNALFLSKVDINVVHAIQKFLNVVKSIEK